LEEIRYIESNGNYVQFVTDKRKIISRLTMNEAAELVPTAIFKRVHRFYIVSKKHITRMDKKTVWVGQTEIPIGAGFSDDASQLLI
jgi:DNA-binding LytR/AlgR family response regulator